MVGRTRHAGFTHGDGAIVRFPEARQQLPEPERLRTRDDAECPWL